MQAKRNWAPVFWIIAIVCGLSIGYLDILAHDISMLFVITTAVTMFLGIAQPRRPWLWTILVAAFIPLSEFFLQLRGAQLQSGEIQDSFLIALVSGLVGAISGAFFNRAVKKLMAEFKSKPAQP
jgi:hypothetical protein